MNNTRLCGSALRLTFNLQNPNVGFPHPPFVDLAMIDLNTRLVAELKP